MSYQADVGLWFGPRPRLPLTEDWDVVVSLLEPDESASLGLADEERHCRAFRSLPIPDRGVPSSLAATRDLVDALCKDLASGKRVYVHCRAGIGRSSLITACVLVARGASPATAWRQLEAARRCPVPDTDEQRDWLTRFASPPPATSLDEALSRLL